MVKHVDRSLIQRITCLACFIHVLVGLYASNYILFHQVLAMGKSGLEIISGETVENIDIEHSLSCTRKIL